MFSYFLLLTFFLIEIYKTVYPDEYNVILRVAKNDLINLKNNVEPKLIYIAYNTIYFYSCCEIYVNKFRLFIKPHIINISKFVKFVLKKYNVIKTDNENNDSKLILEFFYEGQLLTTLDFYKNNKEDIIDKAPIKYDFIVCSSEENNVINKICVSNIHHYFEYDFDFEITKFTFMSLQLLYKEINYAIELKNDKHNFYIVNNKLDKHFFNYYLKYILHLENLDNDLSYNIELLDHNVNMLKLTEKDSITLNADDYIISTNGI